jgi:HSP20 family protein
MAKAQLLIRLSKTKSLKSMNLIRYQRYPQSGLPSVFDRFNTLREEMNRLFDPALDSFVRSSTSFRSWAPALDLYQDRDHFTVVVDLPGMKKEEIDLSLHGDSLTISGERKREEKDDQGLRSERFYGGFQRTITLPSAVDASKVKASYQEGVLQIVLPKAEEAKPRQIEVSLN